MAKNVCLIDVGMPQNQITQLFYDCIEISTRTGLLLASLPNCNNMFVLLSDKIEGRKLKTFYYLTKECDISFAFGVFQLNMTLPLQYLNLCFTYLVLIIQFSTFID